MSKYFKGMIATIVVFILLLIFTLDGKYLGKMKHYSLQSILSKSKVKTIHQGLLIAFLLWLVYYLFHKEIKSFFQTKESMTGLMSLDSVEISDKDKLSRLSKEMISFWNFANGDGKGVNLMNRARIKKGEGLVFSNKEDWAATDKMNKTLTGPKSLVSWATITDNDGSRGGAPIAMFQDESQTFDALVWAERENNKWMVGSDGFKRTNRGTPTTPDSPINTKQCIVMTQDYNSNNDIVIKLYIDGKKVDEYTSNNKTVYRTNEWRLLFGPRHIRKNGTIRSGHFIGTVHAAGLFDRALSAEEVKLLPSLLDETIEKEKQSKSVNESSNESVKKEKQSKSVNESSNESVKYGEPVNLELIDGVTEQPIPLVKISYTGTKTPVPTELNGNDIVEITDANNKNKILVMGKDRFLTMIDKTSQPKPEYDYDQFLLKPEIGELGEKEYKEKISKNPIKYGEKIAISIWSKKQGNTTYNGCGWFGCRVLKPNSGYFSHGGKNRDKVPYTTISQGSTNNVMQTTESVGESVKYGQPVNLELIDGKTKQHVPSLKILNANDKTSTSDATYTKVMFADAENENKILVMGKDRFITMIDTTSQPKPEYQYDTFNILPDFNVNGNPVKPANSPIKFGDKIAISVEKRRGFTGNCGWFGCRVLYPEKGSFGHGGKDPAKVPYTTISQGSTTEAVGESTQNDSLFSYSPSPSDQLIINTPQEESSTIGSMINHPELTKGLTTDNVTPKPIYYEPGTVKYGGLGYVPSYSEMVYYNDYPFKSKPEDVSEGNPHGFCHQKDNIMNNINEKCNELPSNMCATTDCCVLVGGQKCVEGDENGPTDKRIYSDTSIKNRDSYYYRGDCYGNCQGE